MGILSLLVFVCLFVCTVTDFSAAKKVACLFDYYRGRSSHILDNFGSHGDKAATLLQG